MTFIAHTLLLTTFGCCCCCYNFTTVAGWLVTFVAALPRVARLFVVTVWTIPTVTFAPDPPTVYITYGFPHTHAFGWLQLRFAVTFILVPHRTTPHLPHLPRSGCCTVGYVVAVVVDYVSFVVGWVVRLRTDHTVCYRAVVYVCGPFTVGYRTTVYGYVGYLPVQLRLLHGLVTLVGLVCSAI